MPGRAAARLGLLALGLAGCAEPFDEQRQDLVSFRIAAVGVADGVATAALWSGQGLFHTQAPALAWTLNDVAIGQGWQVPVVGYGTLGLTATSPDGTVRQAQVSVREASAALLGVARQAVDLSGALDLDARRALTGAPVEASAATGEGVRLVIAGRDDGESLRWMLGGGVGTLLELDDDTADLLRQEVDFEDGEVVGREDLGSGMLNALVLGLDGAGGNRWLWADAAIGIGDPLARHEGRLVPVSGDAAPGWLAVTLAAAEGLGGVTLADAIPVTDLAEQDALACAAAGQPFRLAWVAEGRCVLADVLGARVVVETW